MTLTTFTSGVNTSFSTELNDNFDHLNDNFYAYFKTDQLSGNEGTTSTTYVTVKTTDVEDDNIYSFDYLMTFGGNNALATAQLLITYADDTTTTQALGGSGSGDWRITTGSFIGTKLIKTIQWQILSSNSSYSLSYRGTASNTDLGNWTGSWIKWITFPNKTV